MMRFPFLLSALLSGLLYLSFPFAAQATDDGAATEFIRGVGREMPAVLGDAKTLDAKRTRLEPFIARVVDVPAVARFCLGRYWATATPGQQQEYQGLFLSVLVNTIATWAGDYKNSAVQTDVVMSAPVKRPDGTYVPTIVQVGGAPPAHINWLINMDTRPPKILDVVAEGFSLRTTQRSDYTSYLAHHNGDLGGLIEILKQRKRDNTGTMTRAMPVHPEFSTQ